MIAFFSIVIAMGLLGVTVYGLHRYQTMEVEYNVDRSMPLPPLDRDSQIELGPRTRAEEPVAADAAAITDEAAAPESVSSRSPVSGWQAALLARKQAGDLDGAYRLCQQQFPLWSAYYQACIILRSKMACLSEDDPGVEPLLTRLYRLAAIAELLHDKSPDARHLTPSQLRLLDLERVAALDFDYRELGYAQLRLVRKQDIKQMQALWGKPRQHQHPASLHRQWWREITRQLA